MELSLLQEDIVNAPYDRIVVHASAACGKTRVMTEKVRQLLRSGVAPSEIAVITFTRLATSELRERLGKDNDNGMFVGTIHSLANQFLLSVGIDTDQLIEQAKFDDLFLLLKHNPNCVKHFQWVLLDEAQDSDDLQCEFIFDMINPKCFFVCGDPNQAIYQWKNGKPNGFMELIRRADVHVYALAENYRNAVSIIYESRKIAAVRGRNVEVIPMRKTFGQVKYLYSDQILEEIEARPPYNQWAILCRYQKSIPYFNRLLYNNGIRYENFHQGGLTKDELIQKMNNNSVKVLTVHAAKGLEWNNVTVHGTRYGEDDDEETCIRYVGATRAKDNLYWLRSRKS